MKMVITILISCILSISITHMMDDRSLNLVKRDILKDSDDTFFAQRTMLINALDDQKWDIAKLNADNTDFSARLSLLANETSKNSRDIDDLVRVVLSMRKTSK